MPAQSMPEYRPWRRYLRFSLRGLIVIVLVIGAGLGWVVRNARIQRDAVAAIQRGTTAFVRYDWEWKDGEEITGGAPWGPNWLVDRLGVDYFGHVTSVTRWDSADSDMPFVQIGQLSRLEDLCVFGIRVEDGLVHLKGSTSLKVLDLSFTDVTDAGLVHLKGLSSLRDLNLSKCKITGAGLVHLSKLKGLQFLDLGGSRVTDDGFVHVAKLTHLRQLVLSQTKITDDGLAHLKGLTSLQHLFLAETEVTDSGLEHLKELTRLKTLGLSRTAVSDGGLAALEGIEQPSGSQSRFKPDHGRWFGTSQRADMPHVAESGGGKSPTAVWHI